MVSVRVDVYKGEIEERNMERGGKRDDEEENKIREAQEFRGIRDFYFRAENSIRGLIRSRRLEDMYKKQVVALRPRRRCAATNCFLYTFDAADEEASLDSV